MLSAPCPAQPAARPPLPEPSSAARLQVPAGTWPARLGKLLETKLFIPLHGCCPQGVLFFPCNSSVCLLDASRKVLASKGAVSCGVKEGVQTVPMIFLTI